MSEETEAYRLGLSLRSILGEISAGFRSYPATYSKGHILVGLGLAEYADPHEDGKGYWLKITDAGRAALHGSSTVIALLDEAGAALQPFAEALDNDADGENDRSSIWESSCAMALEFRHLRAARSLYNRIVGRGDQQKSSAEKCG